MASVKEYIDPKSTDPYQILTNLFQAKKYYKDVLKLQNSEDAYKDLSFCGEDIFKQQLGERGYKHILRQVKDITLRVIKKAQDQFFCMNKNAPNFISCYQFVAFDFLVDDRLKVWLIEVNSHGPGLEGPRWNWKTLRRFFDSILQTVVDKHISPAIPSEKKNLFKQLSQQSIRKKEHIMNHKLFERLAAHFSN